VRKPKSLNLRTGRVPPTTRYTFHLVRTAIFFYELCDIYRFECILTYFGGNLTALF
jgi:hypothetical protein